MDGDRSLRGLILGVDLDGVCADFYGRMREIAAEWLECPISALTPEVSYGLPEWGIRPEEYDNLHRFAVTERQLFSTSPMIEGARKYIRVLSDEGAHIRIMTHRLFINHFHKFAVSQTIDWLDCNGIRYRDLCFLEEKEQVGADIYVEDSPSRIQKLREAGSYTVCFGNSTNRHIGRPRAESWEQVYELIHERVEGQV